AAANPNQRVGGHRLGPMYQLPGFFIADGGDGTGIDEVGVGGTVKGDQSMAPADQLGLHGLGLVLVDLTAQGKNGDIHWHSFFKKLNIASLYHLLCEMKRPK